MVSQLPDEERIRFEHPVQVAVGGAAPPSAVIARMERMGFRVTHLYGLTESFGPATVCILPPAVVAAPIEERAAFTARQGVQHPMLEESTVLDPATLEPVPADGQTLGEVMLRGNTLMKGYLANPTASGAAFAGGWLHTGDLAVLHPDGYLEIKDRAKDIIISGGENISSLEVEEALYRHPDVLEAAVVARPDETWGERPHAFVTLQPGAETRVDAAAIIDWCRGRMAHFKAPGHVTFGPLPKTATGKILEVRAPRAGRCRGARHSISRLLTRPALCRSPTARSVGTRASPLGVGGSPGRGRWCRTDGLMAVKPTDLPAPPRPVPVIPDGRPPVAATAPQPFAYPLQREFVEPDWTRIPGYRGVSQADWESALWQRKHTVKNLKELKAALGDAAPRHAAGQHRAGPARAGDDVHPASRRRC